MGTEWCDIDAVGDGVVMSLSQEGQQIGDLGFFWLLGFGGVRYFLPYFKIDRLTN